jgi:glutathione S-transferase
MADLGGGRFWPDAPPVEPLRDGRERGRIERYSKETRRLFGVLDKRLGEVEFAGGDIAIADFAILGWAWRHERHQIDLAHFPNVSRRYERLMAAPVCSAVSQSP